MWSCKFLRVVSSENIGSLCGGYDHDDDDGGDGNYEQVQGQLSVHDKSNGDWHSFWHQAMYQGLLCCPPGWYGL